MLRSERKHETHKELVYNFWNNFENNNGNWQSSNKNNQCIYGIKKDEKVEIKDKFWKQFDEAIENSAGSLVALGDLNWTTGRKVEVTGRKCKK